MVAAIKAHAVAEASRMEGESDPELWADAAARYGEIPIHSASPTRTTGQPKRSSDATGSRPMWERSSVTRRTMQPRSARCRCIGRSRPSPAGRVCQWTDPSQPSSRRSASAGRPGSWPARSRSSGSLPTAARTARSARPSYQPEDSRRARHPHPRQARRREPCRGRDGCRSAGPARGSRRGSVAGLALDVLPGRDLDCDAAVGVWRAHEDLVDAVGRSMSWMQPSRPPGSSATEHSCTWTVRAVP